MSGSLILSLNLEVFPGHLVGNNLSITKLEKSKCKIVQIKHV